MSFYNCVDSGGSDRGVKLLIKVDKIFYLKVNKICDLIKYVIKINIRLNKILTKFIKKKNGICVGKFHLRPPSFQRI